MALKWAGILVAVVAITLTATANIFATGDHVPNALNLFSTAVAAVAIVVAVAADLYVRVNAKLSRLQELMVSRFDQLDAETGDRNSGFVEGYLLGHGPEAAVVPMKRGRRAAGTGDD